MSCLKAKNIPIDAIDRAHAAVRMIVGLIEMTEMIRPSKKIE